jgi:hypothetical protein
MAAGLPDLVADAASVAISPGGVLPHSIWNQISSGVFAVVPNSLARTRLVKFF